MSSLKRYLVALDGSARAPAVLAQAGLLAHATGAKIRLFRAVPVQPEIPWDLIRSFPPGGLEQLLGDHARADLRARAKSVPANLIDDVAVAVGVPWQAICAAGKDYAADMIVIGSHGYHGLDRVLGTTAVKVVEHADRTVLVVRG